MQAYVEMKGRDYSQEATGLKLHLPEVTAANFNGKIVAIDSLFGELALVSYAAWDSYNFVTEIYTDAATLPASPYAQRERRALFDCVDTVTGRKFTIGIAAPDMDKLALPGTDAINMAHADVLAYITALETYSLSPEGNTLAVRGGKIIGRNV